jgi:tetratricopeptide (TPR) repeat protein
MGAQVEQALDEALALHRAGDPERAERGYRQVLAAAPDHPDALNFLGLLLQDAGRYEESIALLERAVWLIPDFAEALTNLARVQQITGHARAAAESASRAIAADPTLHQAHLLLGRALLDQKDFAGAETPLQVATRLRPGDVDAHLHLGAVMLGLGRVAEAREVYEAAIRADRERIETALKVAGGWLSGSYTDDAVRAYQRAAAIDPQSSRAWGGLAFAYHRQHQPRLSEQACRRALALFPGKTDVRLLLAHELASLGRFDEAADENREALARDPSSVKARQNLVVLGRLTAGDPDAAILSATLRNEEAPGQDRITAAFGLGLAFDRAGDFDQAFAAFSLANQLVYATREAAGRGFQPAALLRRIDWTTLIFQPELFARLADYGQTSDELVFIVGMPRSGTSLVEQIIASHPDVFGCGERKLIDVAVSRLNGENEIRSPAGWKRDDIRAAASRCLAEFRALDGGRGAKRIVDKLPDNIFVLGYIAVLFPNARVIFCNRDMRDVCLSAYFQHFGSEMAWSYDLADCAEQAQQTARLTAHWRRTLPLRMLEVDYESVVSDLEGQARRLIDFLGLEWDPACLSFHQTDREVLTASVWQVRQPIYATAAGRWKHYRRHLTGLNFALLGLVPEPEGEDWNILLADCNQALAAGMIHHRCGRLAAAKRIYDAVFARDPNNATLHHLFGILWLSHGQPAQAIPWLLRALEQQANDVKLRTDLARAYNATDDSAAAAASARIAIENDPSWADAWCQLGYALMDQPDGGSALEAMEKAAALRPNERASLIGMGTALCREKRLPESERLWRLADSLYPADADILAGLANVLSEQDQYEASVEASRQALTCNPGSARLLLLVGSVHLRGRRVEQAIEPLRQALEIDGTLFEGWRIFGYVHAMLGDHKAAATYYRKALSLRPHNGEALAGLVQVAKAEPTADMIQAIAEVRRNPLSSAEAKASVAFALARTHDKRGDYDAAFALFEEANAVVRASRAGFDPVAAESDLAELANGLIAQHSRGAVAAMGPFGIDSDLPAFIVGLPRSGTTLVEQIAAGHPAVSSLGEHGDFLDLLGSEAATMLRLPPDRWDARKLHAATEAFVAQLRHDAGGGTRIINKLPGNLSRLSRNQKGCSIPVRRHDSRGCYDKRACGSL